MISERYKEIKQKSIYLPIVPTEEIMKYRVFRGQAY
jgi:hypothetical protein